jgi:hypothetical protein
VFSTRSIANPARSVDYSDGRLELLNWVRANLNENDIYIFGPNFNWQLEKGTWIAAPKNTRLDFSKFNSFIKKHGVSYVIVSWKNSNQKIPFEGGGELKKGFLVDYFEMDPAEGISEKRRVDGWTLVYKNQKKPVEFLVYKVVR